ncbi:MAG: PorP/SprF family type IX secretion system membrane protein [Capnocytophaga sp.]|nr:PorP/SprF family type IX secretion system membrane protein [Capnocytophaga sp.]
MKKIYTILFISIIFFYGNILTAQSNNFIFYNELQNLINPAAVGKEKGHSISVNLRNQLQPANSDSPKLQTFNTTHLITNRIGLGASVVNDKIFLQKQTAFFADFSYSLPITEVSNLYLGLKAGGNLYSLDGSKFKPYNQEYDPYLQGISGKFQPNVGVGAYFQTPKFYIGASVPNLLASDKTKISKERVTTVSEKMVFYTLGGYYFSLTEDFTIKPAFQFFVSKDIQYQLDATASILYQDFAELGVTYRTSQAINGYILFNIPKFFLSVGYGFESSVQPNISSSVRNIHEFMVKFHW